jgi:hypothetical protein
MNLTEDRLRAALAQVGQEIPEGSVPPLELPGEFRQYGHPTSRTATRRVGRWLPALAAVAAVCLIIGLSVAVTSGHRQSPPAAGSPAQFPPPYYVVLPQPPACGRCKAVVRATRTGKLLATVAAPPRPYHQFASVRGTADDNEFVLSARRPASTITAFFLLRLDPSAPAGHRARLSVLPVTVVTALHAMLTYALSPNGQLLATVAAPQPPGHGKPEITVYNLVTGAHRTWRLPTGTGSQAVVGAVIPQWEPDSRTLVVFEGMTRGPALLVLVTSSGQTVDVNALLTPDGRIVDALLTPDGRYLVELVRRQTTARIGQPPAQASFGIDALPLRTGAVSILRRNAGVPVVLLSSNRAGTAVIVQALGEPAHSHAPLPQYYLWTANGKSRAMAPAGTPDATW